MTYFAVIQINAPAVNVLLRDGIVIELKFLCCSALCRAAKNCTLDKFDITRSLYTILKVVKSTCIHHPEKAQEGVIFAYCYQYYIFIASSSI